MKFERFDFYKKNDYEPKYIYDIGAHQGMFTQDLMSIYLNSQYYLYEANKNNKIYHNNVFMNY